MATPSPVFPLAIATDADLKIANNLIQTTLKVAIDPTNTIIFVTSTAGFRSNALVSIDKEIIAIGNVVDGPNPQLVVATGGRGFDGTSAAAHAASAKVSMYIDAWHHNVLAAEIKAIEEFMGPNGENISTSGHPFLLVSRFDFAPQTPGGSLTTGNNVITLSPVPRGVNGTDVNHYLYITGGAGTPEAVLITGGTAVSGAASGTVIVNCANAHPAGWAIQSATGGMQEAVIASQPGNQILVDQSLTLRANVADAGKKVFIEKLAGVNISGLPAFSILGSTIGTVNSEAFYTLDETKMGLHSDAAATAYPTDSGLSLIRALQATGAGYTQGYSTSTLWAQQDYNGTAGTPFTIRAQLNCPNNRSSNGVACIAAYTEMGANSGTTAIGLHGETNTYGPGSCIAINAEGSYRGASAQPVELFGYVSNMGGGNTNDATMIAAYYIMHPNPGGFNPGGGVKINAAPGSRHAYGVYITGDSGGSFDKAMLAESPLLDAPVLNLNNTNPSLSASKTSIDFYKGISSLLARIIMTHPDSNFSSGILDFSVGSGGSQVTVLRLDFNQLATFSKALKLTPIPASSLPAAGPLITGSLACVNDSTSNSPNTPLIGGGSNTVLAFCAPSGWRVAAA